MCSLRGELKWFTVNNGIFHGKFAYYWHYDSFVNIIKYNLMSGMESNYEQSHLLSDFNCFLHKDVRGPFFHMTAFAFLMFKNIHIYTINFHGELTCTFHGLKILKHMQSKTCTSL